MKNIVITYLAFGLLFSCSGPTEESTDQTSSTDTISVDTFQLDPNFNFEHCPKAWSLEDALAAPDSFCMLALLGNEKRYDAIPEEVQQMHYLRVLDVHGNNISAIPSYLSELEELDVSFNSLKKFPSGLENLTKLKALDASYNRITELDPAIYEMKDLEELNMFQADLTELPIELTKLTKLRKLGWTGCHLETLPKEIANMKNLEELYISDQGHDGFVSLPSNFGDLKRLKHLRIGGNTCCGNQFDSIPSSIFDLDSLEVLDLSYGYIEYVSS